METERQRSELSATMVLFLRQTRIDTGISVFGFLTKPEELLRAVKFTRNENRGGLGLTRLRSAILS